MIVDQQHEHSQQQPQPDQQPNAAPAKPRASRATTAKPKALQADQQAQTDTALGEQVTRLAGTKTSSEKAKASAPKRASTATAAKRVPPIQPSDESTAAQLKLAKAQGHAYARALQAMHKESGAQIQRAGDYEIAVVAERAEGMYHASNGQLHWMEPEHENVHVEVAVRDAADGRFVPGLTVRIHVDQADGGHVGAGELPFIWHPWLYHYGQNWWVPGAGDYRVQVRVEPPIWRRHDKVNGLRYQEPVEVEFTVHVKPGQKLAAG